MFTRHNTEFAAIESTLTVKGAMMTLSAEAMLETSTGWRAASELAPGDDVATSDGGFATIAFASERSYAKSSFLVPAGALDNCSDVILPENSLVVMEAPLEFDATSDLISMPVAALDGYHGIRPAHGAHQTRSFGLETEELVWAQTGMRLHARPMAGAFFQTLRFAEARAMLALTAASQTQDAVAA